MTLTKEKVTDRVEEFRLRNIEMVDEYKGVLINHNFKCLISTCGHIWSSTFNNVYRGKGCPSCSGRVVTDIKTEIRLEGFKTRNIEMLDVYRGAGKKYKFRCLIEHCEYNWFARFDHVFRGSGCPVCSGQIVTENETKRRLQSFRLRNIEMLDLYTGSCKKYKFLCLINTCNHTWSATFNSVYDNGSGCPKCAGQVKTEEEKLMSEARTIIRNRLSAMAKSGQTKTKIHHDDSIMSVLLPYWLTQYKLIPEKFKDTSVKWHMDHIIPVSQFNPYDVDQLKLCWHHTNIQWLTESENTSKRNNLMPRYFTEWHYEVLNKLNVAL